MSKQIQVQALDTGKYAIDIVTGDVFALNGSYSYERLPGRYASRRQAERAAKAVTA